MWGWVAWTVAVLVVWLVVGGVLGMLIGRVIRRRNEQAVNGADGSLPARRTGVAAPVDREGRRRSSSEGHAPRRP